MEEADMERMQNREKLRWSRMQNWEKDEMEPRAELGRWDKLG